MVICFDCQARSKDLLDKLVASGGYKDYSEALASAIENLSVLQSHVLERGSLVLSAAERRGRRTSTTVSEDGAGKVERRLFRLEGLPRTAEALADMPSDDWPSGDDVPLDRWIFGQYNRLLPAKASCRALAHLLAKEPKGIPLKEVAEKIADEARLLGNQLKQHDEEHGIERDDALSTGFPIAGSAWTQANPIARYANHFVGHVSKGKLSGLLADVKLINLTGDDPLRVRLTSAGWHFAVLPNPVLDTRQEHPREKFSAEEIAFLLDHVRDHVPVERFAYRTILTAIDHGAYTPETLDSALQGKYLDRTGPRAYSKAFLSSQRSGAVSRMADLCLVARIRNGTKVTYNLLKGGAAFLAEIT